jgi:VanZ family protein
MKRIFDYLTNHSWLAILWTLVMCVLFFIPTPPSTQGPLIPHLDKVVHLGLFAGFVVLWGIRLPNATALLVIIGIVFGIVVECIQDGMKLGRSFDVYDIVADSVGVFVGILTVSLIRQYIKKATN